MGVPKASDPHSSQSNDQEMSDDKRSDDLKNQEEASDTHSSQTNDQEMSDDKRSDDLKEQKKMNSAPAGAASAAPKATGDSEGTTNQDSKSSSENPDATNQQQDANASSTDTATKQKTKSVSESHEDWFSRVTKEGQEVLWYPKASARCPTLLTGVQPSNLKGMETSGWEDKLESADLEKHAEYLRGRKFVALPHPLEATAWENGFVPETHGLPSNELEQRTLPLLPQLSHMVSAPRQPVATGNALLTRFDANIRPYWLRDWQSGFGGYTKVYEYQCGDKTKRMYSVAHVVRPRTATSEACLCFSLMEAMPSCKPWKRPAGQKDPSRSVLLDLRPFPNWQLPATVLDLGNDIAKDLTDDLQVQCLPVARSSTPKWTYRTLPKVTNFRTFGRLPPWDRKPQKMTYHVCAEDITKNCIVPNLPDDEKEDLLTRGALPPSSSARDMHCVMCPVRRGSPRLIPCCLCYNWCHPGCSYQTHLGRVCPCHVQILDPKRKIMVLKYPYHEDLVVLPTRPNLRMDTKSIARDNSYRPQTGESLMRWSASLWINTLLEKHAWLSAGLVWMNGASQSADMGVYSDVPPETPEARPVISLFEHWEEGAHLPVALNARDYAFPSSLVIPFYWTQVPQALSLQDAINSVSTHGERKTWGQASHIKLVPGVNYPNQPKRVPDSHLSDPLTYWWGVTLCPPELNDVALAETVVILMRIAAIREIHLNEEVNKPSLAEVLEYRGLKMDCSVESTPHEEACVYSSAYDGGELMTQFGASTQHDEANEFPTRAHGEFATTENPWPKGRARVEGSGGDAKEKAVFYPETRKQVGPVW